MCAALKYCEESFIGFQSCSKKMTVSAPVRLSPSPPTWAVRRRTSTETSLLNLQDILYGRRINLSLVHSLVPMARLAGEPHAYELELFRGQCHTPHAYCACVVLGRLCSNFNYFFILLLSTFLSLNPFFFWMYLFFSNVYGEKKCNLCHMLGACSKRCILTKLLPSSWKSQVVFLSG